MKKAIELLKQDNRLSTFLDKDSKHELEDLKKIIGEKIKQRFPHRKGRLLGNKTKAYPHSIYENIFNHFKMIDEEIALAVEVEGIEGPRINDVLQIKVSCVDFLNHRLRVYNHKVSHWYEVPLAEQVEKDLKAWITEHRKEIDKHEGYLFYTRDSEHHPKTKRPFLTSQFINRKIVAYLESEGLNPVYALRQGDGGRLHLFTTHSGRGHAATRIKNITGSREAAMQLLDHSPRSAESTEVYFERDEGELEKGMRAKP